MVRVGDREVKGRVRLGLEGSGQEFREYSWLGRLQI